MKKNIFVLILAVILTSCVGKNHSTFSKSEDKYDRLLKIGQLRDNGILTEDEFNIEKQKILYENSTDKKSQGVNSIVVNSSQPLSKCEQIIVEFDSLPIEKLDSPCAGHSMSFDFYSDLQTNGCGEYKELISISKEGYEEACIDGKKDGVNRN